MKTKAVMILGQDYWEISLPIGNFLNKEMGLKALNNATAVLSIATPSPDSNVYGILLKIDDCTRFIKDSDVQIKELSQSARDRLGSPIDISSPEGQMKAIESLETMNSAYVMGEEDFILSDKTLKDFVEYYGVGYTLDHIGNEIVEI